MSKKFNVDDVTSVHLKDSSNESGYRENVPCQIIAKRDMFNTTFYLVRILDRENQFDILKENEMSAEVSETPSSHWKANGEADPHGIVYDCERSQLTMGKLTDDELANGAFMNYDIRPAITDIIAGKAFSPIAWMTAVKDRIRWLSRSLIKEEQKSKAAIDFIRQLSNNETLPEDIQKQITEFLKGV